MRNKIYLRQKQFTYSSFALALFFLPFGVTQAQEAPNAGALQRELELQLQRSKPTPQVQPKKPTAPREVSPSEQTLEVKDFAFTGNTLFSADKLAEVVKPWIGRTITFVELNDVTTAIQDFYRQQGRLALVSVPPQEVKNGIVQLQIVESKMGKVSVTAANPEQVPRFSTERVALYFSKDADGHQFIDTRAVERSTLLLNELLGLRANTAFEAGDQTGFSNINVALEGTSFFSGQLVTSNYGSSSTGVAQAIANLSLNNLSGLGDQVTLDAIQSQGSSYVQGAYIFPVGTDGWKVGLQSSYLQYKTLSSWASSQTEGYAVTYNANANYALLRSQGANANFRLAGESRYYNNTQGDTTISDYLINAVTAGVNGNLAYSNSNTMNYGVTVTVGHLGISNLTQAGQDLTGPGTAGSYQKLSFNLSNNQELEIFPNTSWLISVYGQIANKNLNSSEQIYMGGPYGVRSYPVAQGGGSQGAIFTTELNHRLDQNWQVGAFADLGIVQQYVNLYTDWKGLTNANNNYQLGDAGLSVKYAYNTFFLSAAAAYRIGNNPLYTSSGQQLNADNAYKSVQVWIKGSWGF